MSNDYDDRYRNNAWRDGDRARNDRDWTDKASDEVRSWAGDDQAERRRDMDKMRDERDSYSRDRSYGARDRGDEGSYTRRGMMTGMDPRSGRNLGGYRDDRGYRDERGYGSSRRDERHEDRGFFDKAGDEVASWFGDEEAARRREADAKHRGRGPKGYTRSDERIKEDVSERLMDDAWLDASNIEVSVDKGEVTLTGTVTQRDDKRRAEDLAERASGVNHVQNNLRVGNGSGTTADLLSTDPNTNRGIL